MLISKLFARNADAMVVAAAVAEVADFGLGCAHLFIESSRTSGATTVFHLFCNHLKRTSREKDFFFGLFVRTRIWLHVPLDSQRIDLDRVVHFEGSIFANIRCNVAKHWLSIVEFVSVHCQLNDFQLDF